MCEFVQILTALTVSATQVAFFEKQDEKNSVLFIQQLWGELYKTASSAKSVRHRDGNLSPG